MGARESGFGPWCIGRRQPRAVRPAAGFSGKAASFPFFLRQGRPSHLGRPLVSGIYHPSQVKNELTKDHGQ